MSFLQVEGLGLVITSTLPAPTFSDIQRKICYCKPYFKKQIQEAEYHFSSYIMCLFIFPKRPLCVEMTQRKPFCAQPTTKFLDCARTVGNASCIYFLNHSGCKLQGTFNVFITDFPAVGQFRFC